MLKRTDNATTAYRIRVIVVIAAIAGMLFSWELWMSSRVLPAAPVLPLLPDLPRAVGWMFALALLGLLAVHAKRTPPIRATVALVAVAAIVLALDQSRWQPWVYQYAAVLAALLYLPSRREDAHASALDASRIVVASMYAWGGIQKMNAAFYGSTWPWLTERFAAALPGFATGLRMTGFVVPIVELALGIGLLHPRTRRFARWAVIAQHLLLMLLIGPYGLSYDAAIWPWNEALILLVFFLFANDAPIRVPPLRGPLREFAFEKAVLALFCVMPAFGYLGAWDAYLSAGMYSGNRYDAVISLDRAAMARMPEDVWRIVTPEDDRMALVPYDWGVTELGAPVYPEPRVYRTIADELCDRTGRAGVTLTVIGRPGFLTAARRSATQDCDDQ